MVPVSNEMHTLHFAYRTSTVKKRATNPSVDVQYRELPVKGVADCRIASEHVKQLPTNSFLVRREGLV